MKSNPFDGLTRPSLPTLSDIQRRMVELTGKPLQLEPQPQRQIRPAPLTPPLPSAPPNPILGEAALYGPAGRVVRALAPHSEAHPAAILLQYGTTAPQAPPISSAHPPATPLRTVSAKPSTPPPTDCPESK
jgi:hypothetical protein